MGVMLEIWTDINANNNWVKTHHIFDSGQWPVADPSKVQSNCRTTGQPCYRNKVIPSSITIRKDKIDLWQ